MTPTRIKDHRLDRTPPKVLFVDDLNTYRDMLPGITPYQIMETVANSYMANWALPVKMSGRNVSKTSSFSLDPDILPYPEIKFRNYVVESVDVATLDRQLVITFNMGYGKDGKCDR